MIDMKKYLIFISLIFFFACSNNPETEQENNLKETPTEYTLIKDNLYTDGEGNLYLKSRTQEYFKTGKWIDVWLKRVCRDSSWTPTEDGWKDIAELKELVDVSSFHLDTTDNEKGGDFYKDKNHTYFHKWMADGGTISLFEK